VESLTDLQLALDLLPESIRFEEVEIEIDHPEEIEPEHHRLIVGTQAVEIGRHAVDREHRREGTGHQQERIGEQDQDLQRVHELLPGDFPHDETMNAEQGHLLGAMKGKTSCSFTRYSGLVLSNQQTKIQISIRA
jgi:hypothetical protein